MNTFACRKRPTSFHTAPYVRGTSVYFWRRAAQLHKIAQFMAWSSIENRAQLRSKARESFLLSSRGCNISIRPVCVTSRLGVFSQGFDPKISEKLASDFADKWVEVRPPSDSEIRVLLAVAVNYSGFGTMLGRCKPDGTLTIAEAGARFASRPFASLPLGREPGRLRGQATRRKTTKRKLKRTQPRPGLGLGASRPASLSQAP